MKRSKSEIKELNTELSHLKAALYIKRLEEDIEVKIPGLLNSILSRYFKDEIKEKFNLTKATSDSIYHTYRFSKIEDMLTRHNYIEAILNKEKDE